MKVTNTVIHEEFILSAILGARKSYGSGPRSDSHLVEGQRYSALAGRVVPALFCSLGPDDQALAARLVKAGSGHAKFLRHIPVAADVLATSTWWRQLDQHKVGVTTSSASMMHRAASKGEFTPDDFGGDNHSHEFLVQLEALNSAFRRWRDSHTTRRGELWKSVVDKVMNNYLYDRTLELNYAALLGIYLQRYNHRWDEWAEFLDWAATLPYAMLLIMPEEATRGRKD
jgi:hypothetical protein